MAGYDGGDTAQGVERPMATILDKGEPPALQAFSWHSLGYFSACGTTR